MANNNQEESVFSDPEMTQRTSQDPTPSGPPRGSKNRVLLVVGGVLAVVILIFFAMSMMGKSKKSSDSGAIPAASGVNNVPGASGSPVYEDLVKKENEERAQQQGTTLPVLTSDPNATVNDPFSPNAQTVTPTPIPEVVVPPAPVAQYPEPAVAPVAQPEPVYSPPPVQLPTHSPEQYAATTAALQTYIQSWQIAPTPTQEFSYNGVKPVPDPTVAANGQVGVSPSAVSAVGATAQQGASFVRAGTVIPAMLLSVIDSDNPGPILAQITSGPLAGTRLIGEFKSTGKALTLSFSTMSKPGLGTFSVNVVAVDDNYAVGMQTDVNNHYFRRYGLLLAASFLQGYGEAISRTNTTITTGPFGSTVSQGELSADQARKVAYGKMGEAVTENLLTESDVPPTVKLDCGGGCPVGLLFLSDL